MLSSWGCHDEEVNDANPMQEGKKEYQKLIKSSTSAVVPGSLVVLFSKPLILVLVYISFSIENPSPQVDRIVPL